MARQNVRILPFIDKDTYITSIFWEDRGGRPHKGVDLSASGSGVPLYSMCDGKVILKAFDVDGFGNYIIIKDNISGLGFLYAHLESVIVNKNDDILNGQQVGTQGMTGYATGNHLHLEMQDISNRNWKFNGDRSDYINPADWIGYREIIGDILYYDGTPTPIKSSNKKGFKWVLYARKLRNKNIENKFNF